MRIIAAALVSAGLVASLAGSGEALAKSSKRLSRDYDIYASKYPSATPRQLRNAMAYDRGGYYEMDSNAHPPGSRGWWDLKERESGGDFRR